MVLRPYHGSSCELGLDLPMGGKRTQRLSRKRSDGLAINVDESRENNERAEGSEAPAHVRPDCQAPQ
jgi:hypothetical protein